MIASHKLRSESPSVLPFRADLHTPDESAPDPDRLTLRDCFAQFLLPDLEDTGVEQTTLDQYEYALGHWEKHTENPPVGAVHWRTLPREWSKAMLAAGAKPATVEKNWRHLRAIWRRIGPPVTGNPLGEDLIERVPYLAPLPKDDVPKRFVAFDEWDAMYAGCSAIKFTKCDLVPGPMLWRAVIVFAYHFGCRPIDLFHLDREQISLAAECPERRYRVSNPHGWLIFTPKKTRKKKPAPLYLPLNAVCRTHVEKLLRGHRKRLFPVGNRAADWLDVRRELQEAAGLQEPYITYQDMRQTCSSTWDRAGGVGLGKHVLGQAARGVNEEYYQITVGRLVDVVGTLPVPASFLNPPDCDTRQKSLF